MKITVIRKTLTSSLKLVLVAAAFAVAAVALSTGLSTGTAQADTMNWDAVAQCESGGKWNANTGNGHYGGLQFKQATWTSNGGFGSPATASRSEQIRVAENVLASQGTKAWPTCGSHGGTPAIWNVSSTTPAPAATGCQALPTNALFGFVNFRQMCAALTTPRGAAR